MSARVALLMDTRPGGRHHAATVGALEAAGAEVDWVRTDALASPAVRERVASAGGVLLGPGSPYEGREQVLGLVRRAREELIPFVGT